MTVKRNSKLAQFFEDLSATFTDTVRAFVNMLGHDMFGMIVLLTGFALFVCALLAGFALYHAQQYKTCMAKESHAVCTNQVRSEKIEFKTTDRLDR